MLARMELEAFLPHGIADLPKLMDAPYWVDSMGDYARASGQQAFTATAPLDTLPELVKRLSFVQRIYCRVPDTAIGQDFITTLVQKIGAVYQCHTAADGCIIEAVPHYALFEMADVVTRRAKSVSETRKNLTLLLNGLTGRDNSPSTRKWVDKALAAKASIAALSHDIHYYKAKFFPRMARSMLNVCSQQVDAPTPRVMDNFAGSGTTLLEAALLGMPSVGLDIDPLSVLIARTKLDVLTLDPILVEREAITAIDRLRVQSNGHEQTESIAFPHWLLKNRKMTPDIADQLSDEMTVARAVIDSAPDPVRDVFRVLLSDAITRRIRMRFLGTGAGRFSLTFSKTSLADLLVDSLRKTVATVTTADWLRQTLTLHLASAQVIQADTRHIPPALGRFDIMLNSPPYLPASSGRESYARARAPSLLALGMVDRGAVDTLVDESIGSMEGSSVELTQLDADVQTLVRWLQSDDLRAPKAEPTGRYFVDMRQTFAAMIESLCPGGMAVVVSGKQNTFYQHRTRDVLYTVETADLLARDAERAGFDIIDLHHLLLKKGNMNARPRSLDAYYETLIILQKPC